MEGVWGSHIYFTTQKQKQKQNWPYIVHFSSGPRDKSSLYNRIHEWSYIIHEAKDTEIPRATMHAPF